MKKRVRDAKGQFTEGAAVEERSEPVPDEPAAVGAPRPGRCRSFARKRMAEQMPGIVDVLIEKTKDGSVAHAKVLLELTGVTKDPVTPSGTRRRGKSVTGRLLEEIAEMEKASALELKDKSGA